MILVSGAKTIAEEYNCSGAILSITRFLRRNCLASFRKNPSVELFLDLIGLAKIENVIGTALLQEGSVNKQLFRYYQSLFQ